MDFLSTITDSGTDDLRDEVIKEFYDDRVLVINGDISDYLLEDVILHILRFNAEDKDIPPEKRHRILIICDSEGGSVFTANNLIDVIKCSKTPVYALGMSIVASAALSIFINCHKRYSFKYTTFLQHDGSKSVNSSGSKARDFMNFLDRLDELDKRRTLEATNITEEEYDKAVRDEQFFFSNEAKTKGVVDYIVGEDCDLDDIL
jgi:ATP-dependent Clp protease protease subunit